MSVETEPIAEPSTPPRAEPPLTIIGPRPGSVLVHVNELWRYGERLGFLILRDIKVRYKQTMLGAAWAVLQPLAIMLVFVLFLRDVARDARSPLPYPLFVFSGMLLWTSFAN